MPRIGLQYNDFVTRANQFVLENNKVPTLVEIQTALNTTASMTTLSRFLKDWKDDCVLLSVRKSEEFIQEPQFLENQLGEILSSINKKREEKIKNDQEAKNQTIVDLKEQLHQCSTQLQHYDETIKALQTKCESYQLNELKLKADYTSLHEDTVVLRAKVQQAEDLILPLRESHQKLLQQIKEQSDQWSKVVYAQYDVLEKALNEKKKLLEEKYELALKAFMDEKNTYEKKMQLLQEELQITQSQLEQLQREHHSLQMNNQAMTEKIRSHETTKSLLDEQYQRLKSEFVQSSNRLTELNTELLGQFSELKGADLHILSQQQQDLVEFCEKIFQRLVLLQANVTPHQSRIDHEYNV